MLQKEKLLGTKAPSMRAHLGMTKIAFKGPLCHHNAEKDHGSGAAGEKAGQICMQIAAHC